MLVMILETCFASASDEFLVGHIAKEVLASIIQMMKQLSGCCWDL